MTVPTQPGLFDAQAENIQRVRGRIGPAVYAFCCEHLGGEFHGSELKEYVEERAMVAPASPDRILRDLRQGGFIDYVIVSRSKSLYRITAVYGAGNGASITPPPRHAIRPRGLVRLNKTRAPVLPSKTTPAL